MRYSVFIILACLLLILPVTGYTVPHIQTVIQCSNDNISTNAGNGAVDIKSTPPGAWYTIDGNPMGMTPGGQFLYKGTYTVTLTFPHSSAFNDYSTSVVVCDQKVTYVKATLVPITTTVVTTAAPVRLERTFAQATTTSVTGITTATASTIPGVTAKVTQHASTPVVSGSAAQPDMLGSLSITTNPSGAFIFIDGVQRGVTPATIPGLSAGTHTLLLKQDGYQDISTPVTIVAGKTQDYSSGMAKNAATTSTVTPKKTPGFECVYAFAGLGGFFLIRKRNTK
jgi:hypothetical protein